MLVASVKVISRVETCAAIMFLLWFWEKAISCDGYEMV